MPLESPLPAARLKRRLLREVVEENVALIEGRAPARRPRGRPLRDLSRLLLVVVAGVVLLRSPDLLAGRQQAAAPVSGRGGAAAPSDEGLVAAMKGGDARLRIAASQVPSTPQPPRGLDPTVFPIAVRRVAIDAGHGGSNSGARAGQELVEKELTLDIARRVERTLAASDLETLMTRDSDRDVPLRERARLANEAGADLFLSIHINWLEDREARGVETYYAGISEDADTNRLAIVENSEYGHSFADLRALLERLYTQVRQEESMAFAAVVQDALWRSLATADPLLADRGVKAAPFTVLISTDMPSVLAEVSCLSNEEEARRLTDPEYRQAIAEALARGVRSYAARVSAAAARRAATTTAQGTRSGAPPPSAAEPSAMTAHRARTTAQKGT